MSKYNCLWVSSITDLHREVAALQRYRSQCSNCSLRPGRLAALEKWLPNSVTILDKFHCTWVAWIHETLENKCACLLYLALQRCCRAWSTSTHLLSSHNDDHHVYNVLSPGSSKLVWMRPCTEVMQYEAP